MPCDPKKIYTDLIVYGNSTTVGTVLTYAELWVSGGSKLAVDNAPTDTVIYNFIYKNTQYYNTFDQASDGSFTKATIRTGTFDPDNPTAGTVIEEIIY